MAFFQDLGKKTSDMMEISKLNSSISKEQAAIVEVQKKIGVTAYELFAAGQQLPEAFLPDLQEIAEKYRSIIDLENKIAEIKAEAERYKEAQAQAQAAAQAQAQAAAQAKAQAQAQPPAHAPYQAPVPPPAPAAPAPAAAPVAPPAAAPAPQVAPSAGNKFCVSCGAQIVAGAAFCSKCGTKAE